MSTAERVLRMPSSPPTPARRRAAASCVALALILAVGAYLRFHYIAAKSFWIDEGVSAAFTRLDWYNLARILWRREANMTLYYLLLRAWSQLGDSEVMLRGFSAVMSLAAVATLYALGRRLFNARVGLAAALLLALNAYAVRYAQEARSYSLVMFLATLASFFFVCATQTACRRDWTWYVIAASLAIYAHFFAVLVIVAHGVTLHLSRPPGPETAAIADADAHRAFPRAAKRIALATAPVWLFIATTGAGPIHWITRPHPRDLYWMFEMFAGNGGAPLFWLYVVCALLTALAAVRGWRPLRSAGSAAEAANAPAWGPLFLLTWFLAPVVITLLFSLARPVFLMRYMIICLPALVLMTAAGAFAFRASWMTLPVLALIAWFALGGVRSYYQRDLDLLREDYRGATHYILEHAQPGDVVLFHKSQGRFAYSYYAGHFAAPVRPAIIFPGHDRPVWRDFMGKMTPAILSEVEHTPGRVWLVLSENFGPGGEDSLCDVLKVTAAHRHPPLDQRQFDFLRVYLYGSPQLSAAP